MQYGRTATVCHPDGNGQTLRLAGCTSLFALMATAVLGFLAPASGGEADAKANWRAKLAEELPLLGHRNWIVVADSAYPAQSRPGIETIYVGGCPGCCKSVPSKPCPMRR